MQTLHRQLPKVPQVLAEDQQFLFGHRRLGVQGNFAGKDRAERGAKVSVDEVHFGARLIVGRLLRCHERLDI